MNHAAINPSAETPIPILVVGLNRSGTKWLSNILCNHPDVAGAQSERAQGILETNMFHRMQEKFDLRSADDYVGFIELWSRTEFFRIIGEDITFLYGLEPRPLSFVRIFELVMQRYAERAGAKYWLQKCGPERAIQIVPALDHPKIVTISRDTVAVGSSLRQMNYNRYLEFSLLKGIPGLARAEKLLNLLSKQYPIISTTYEALANDSAAAIAQICRQLDLPFSNSLLDVRYSPNTSFRTGRSAPLTRAHTRLLRMTATCFRTLPVWLLDRMLKVSRKQRIPLRFVAGTFGDLKDRLADRHDYYT